MSVLLFSMHRPRFLTGALRISITISQWWQPYNLQLSITGAFELQTQVISSSNRWKIYYQTSFRDLKIKYWNELFFYFPSVYWVMFEFSFSWLKWHFVNDLKWKVNEKKYNFRYLLVPHQRLSFQSFYLVFDFHI